VHKAWYALAGTAGVELSVAKQSEYDGAVELNVLPVIESSSYCMTA
jgi:hypothetical protein